MSVRVIPQNEGDRMNTPQTNVLRHSLSASTVLLVVAVVAWKTPTRVVADDAPRPNIILIMSDDMGFSDIGCYGGEIETPHLNRLAKEGLRFTQFYNTARCCPTRAALLTGLYQHQAGVGHMMSDDGLPGYQGNFSNHCVTIAEVLKSAGYGTYLSGKWHVTRHITPDGPKFNWPLQRGFDRFYGTIHGAGSFFDPNTLTRDNTMISPAADAEYQPERFYYTDAISDHAVRFIADHFTTHAEQPFFLYVSYTAAHWPMHALEKDIAKYRGRYDGGYQPIRRTRFERMKKLGLIDANWKLSPQARHWENVEHKAWEARCMEVYAAMIDNMDQGIGRIIDAVNHTGRRDNTLILFLQDNGGCAETLGRRAPEQARFTERPDAAPFAQLATDFLQPSMIPKQTRDGFPLVMGAGIMPGPPDSYIAYGEGWANVSNTPFRRYKHWVHEGGISTPLIAHWPSVIKQHGKLTDQPGHLIDIMATCVDVAGADYPDSHRGHAITPLAGKSLLPILQGKQRQGHGAIFWEHEGNRAVRRGDWKLVGRYPHDWELYNLKTDRTEQHNLAAEHPKKIKQMTALYDNWAARSSVVPWEELQRIRNARRDNPTEQNQ